MGICLNCPLFFPDILLTKSSQACFSHVHLWLQPICLLFCTIARFCSPLHFQRPCPLFFQKFCLASLIEPNKCISTTKRNVTRQGLSRDSNHYRVISCDPSSSSLSASHRPPCQMLLSLSLSLHDSVRPTHHELSMWLLFQLVTRAVTYKHTDADRRDVPSHRCAHGEREQEQEEGQSGGRARAGRRTEASNYQFISVVATS